MVSVSDKALWIDGLAGGRWFKVCLRVETFKWPLVWILDPQGVPSSATSALSPDGWFSGPQLAHLPGLLPARVVAGARKPNMVNGFMRVCVWSCFMLRLSLCYSLNWLFCPWDIPGKDTGVGCHSLLQGIFPTQGSNSHLLHCRWSFYSWATREAQMASY